MEGAEIKSPPGTDATSYSMRFEAANRLRLDRPASQERRCLRLLQ
jgi:hypothetical protein